MKIFDQSNTFLLVNTKAGNTNFRKVKILSEMFHIGILPLSSFPNFIRTRNISTLCIFGGDGTLHSVVSMLLQHKKYPRLMVFKGGSDNHFFNMLVGEGAVVSGDSWHKVNKKSIVNAQLPFLRFFPGIIECRDGGDLKAFVVGVGFGVVETSWVSYLEKFRRFIPAKLAYYVAGLLTAVSVFPNKASFYSIMISEQYDRLCIPLKKSLQKTDLLEVKNQYKGLRNYCNIGVCVAQWKLGFPLKKDALAIKKIKKLTINASKIPTCVDGECIILQGPIRIYRSKRPIECIACILP